MAFVRKLFIGALFIPIFCPGQDWQWNKQFHAGGGNACIHGMATDPSFGTYAAGNFDNTLTSSSSSQNFISAGGTDIMIGHYNTTVTPDRFIQDGGPADDGANSVTIDGSGNIFLTGYFSATATFQSAYGAISNTVLATSNGGKDIFIAKYAQTGQLLWVRTFGGPGDDEGASIVKFSASEIYCTGYFNNQMILQNDTLLSQGGSDIFIVKLDGSGNILFDKSAGGPSADKANSIAADAAGNFYVTGNFSQSASFDNVAVVSAGLQDIFLAKYNPGGSLTWLKRTGGNGNDDAFSLSFLTGIKIGISGYFEDTLVWLDNIQYPSSGGTDGFAGVIDTAGNSIYLKQVNGPGNDAVKSISMKTTGFCITGYFSDTARFDNTSRISNGLTDIFVASYNSSANLNWVQKEGGTYADTGFATAATAIINHAGGMFTGNCTFSDGGHTNGSGSPSFQLSYSNTGVINHEFTGSAYSISEIKQVEEHNGYLYLFGNFIGTVSYDTVQLRSACETFFIAKADTSGHIIWIRSGEALSPVSRFEAGNFEFDDFGRIYYSAWFTGDLKVGNTIINPPSTAYNRLLFRADTNGIISLIKYHYSVGATATYMKVACDHNGNVYYYGECDGNISGSDNIVVPLSNSAIIIKYDSAGIFQWHDFPSGGNYSFITGIAFDGLNNRYVSGKSGWPLPGYNLSYCNGVYLVKLSPSDQVVWSEWFYGNFEPAPASDHTPSLKILSDTEIVLKGDYSDTLSIAGYHLNRSNIVGIESAGYVAAFDTSGMNLWVKDLASGSIRDMSPLRFGFDHADNISVILNEGFSGSGVYLDGNLLPNSDGTVILTFEPAAGHMARRFDVTNSAWIDGLAPFDSLLYLGGYAGYTCAVGGDTIYTPSYDNPYTASTASTAFITKYMSLCPVASFTTSGTNGNFSFSNLSQMADSVWWEFGDGDTSAVFSPSHQYLNSGIYTVCLHVYNSCGTDSICRQIQYLITSDYSAAAEKNIRVYPNPATDQLFFDFKTSENKNSGTFEIFSLSGQLMKIIPVADKNAIVISDLAEGMYFYTIKQDEAILKAGKFIKL